MDPFTILGVACNIWTFVEVGIKVLKTTNDMYSKGSGTTQDASTIEESIGVMKQSIDALKSSEGPQELQLLSQQCQALSRQLFKILAKLKITNKKSRLQYFKVVWISTWNASKIATIETKLSNMRSVLTMYQLTLMNEKASVFKRKLDKIEAGVDALSIERGHELARQRTDIIALLESRCTEDVAKKLRVMEESMRVSEVETKILNQLRFSALKRREDGIEDAKHGTYAWILKRSKGETNLMKEIRKTFASWLKFEAGVFHISGKPGAGKSTLMKFIATHPETRRHVEQTWAKGTDLCYASFFFYNAGGEDEKSLEGLYRSILYTVLNDCPGLMPTVFPDFFRRDELVQERLLLDITRPQQIRNTFQKFINIATGGKYKICLFIDGLDEYKGDATEHRNLAEQLRSWAANSEGHVKFCVSSRPHVQFTQTFAPSGSLARQIHLHELTRNDIARHCLSAFQGDTQYHRLPALQSECNALVEAIADRAEGVFLWAHFVVRFVLEEAKQEGTRDDLWRRLDEIPEKIDDLYDQLLGSLKKQDRLVANQMLMAVLTNPFKDSLNIMCLKWLKEGKKWDKFPLETYRHDQRQARDAVESAINHLNGWTRGLIELEFKKKRKTVRGREYDTSSTDSEISSSSVECSMRSMRQTSSEASHSAERMKPLTVVGPEDDRLRIPVEAPEPTSPSHPDECYIITDPSWQPPSQQRDSKSVVGHGESTSSLAQSSEDIPNDSDYPVTSNAYSSHPKQVLKMVRLLKINVARKESNFSIRLSKITSFRLESRSLYQVWTIWTLASFTP
ncbi:hypothetical protein F5Y18DRAFT_74768 [Xylariaceae sp. FL1019]|nr:hypothetical protein F5Y18DRAFT_74768 [Xylariaceae sp. FL1019]